MTWDQFWNDDPWLAAVYRRKHNLDIESRNQELWMQGLYIHNAVATVIGNAFGKKGTKPEQYLEKPIRITPMTEQEKQIEAENERIKAIKYFSDLAKRWKETHKEEDNAAGN